MVFWLGNTQCGLCPYSTIQLLTVSELSSSFNALINCLRYQRLNCLPVSTNSITTKFLKLKLNTLLYIIIYTYLLYILYIIIFYILHIIIYYILIYIWCKSLILVNYCRALGVIILTADLNIDKLLYSAGCFKFIAWISEQTAFIYFYNITLFAFISQDQYEHWAVRNILEI
jgi:hypothetical protein